MNAPKGRILWQCSECGQLMVIMRSQYPSQMKFGGQFLERIAQIDTEHTCALAQPSASTR